MKVTIHQPHRMSIMRSIRKTESIDRSRCLQAPNYESSQFPIGPLIPEFSASSCDRPVSPFRAIVTDTLEEVLVNVTITYVICKCGHCLRENKETNKKGHGIWECGGWL